MQLLRLHHNFISSLLLNKIILRSSGDQDRHSVPSLGDKKGSIFFFLLIETLRVVQKTHQMVFGNPKPENK